MYWNTIRRHCIKYMMKYKYPCSRVVMSKEYYLKLEEEMVGKQWLTLVKQSSVLGCQVVVDTNISKEIIFVLQNSKGENSEIVLIEELK